MTTIRKIIIEPESKTQSGSCRSHSPLPWKSHTDEKTGWPQVISARKPNGKRTIVVLFPAMEENEIKFANAAFIVRACNNAQRLADELKWIIGDDTSKELASARQALAQWEKEGSDQ